MGPRESAQALARQALEEKSPIGAVLTLVSHASDRPDPR